MTSDSPTQETTGGSPPATNQPVFSYWKDEFGIELDDRVQMYQWEAAHDMHVVLLPFEFQDTNPLILAARAQRKIAEAPPTRRRFYAADIAGDDVIVGAAPGYDARIQRLLEACGLWHYGDTARRKKYANPEYVHRSSFPDPFADLSPGKRRAERIDFARRHAAYGYYSLEDVASRLAMPVDDLRALLDDDGFEWDARRADGRLRMAKTAATIIDWCGEPWTYAKVDALFGQPEGTFESWAQEIDDEWVPPEDPTPYSWFRPGSRWRGEHPEQTRYGLPERP